jgi:hypothetical protein
MYGYNFVPVNAACTFGFDADVLKADAVIVDRK